MQGDPRRTIDTRLCLDTPDALLPGARVIMQRWHCIFACVSEGKEKLLLTSVTILGNVSVRESFKKSQGAAFTEVWVKPVLL